MTMYMMSTSLRYTKKESMMNKVFFFDVDGTLLPHGNKRGVAKETIYALNQLIENGYDVVLATGKAEGMIKEQLAQINVDSYITMNGAQICVHNKLVYNKLVTQDVIDQLMQIARENNLMLGCQTRYDYNIVDVNFDHDYAQTILSKVSLNVPTVKDQFCENDQINQLWFIGDNSCFDFNKEIIEGYKLVKWDQFGCDIVDNKISKATAIKEYLNQKYSDARVKTYAFGDSYNDIEMIAYVDYGIAMGNGCDSLKEIADEITNSCEQLGVYNYLLKNRFIKELDEK